MHKTVSLFDDANNKKRTKRKKKKDQNLEWCLTLYAICIFKKHFLFNNQ